MTFEKLGPILLTALTLSSLSTAAMAGYAVVGRGCCCATKEDDTNEDNDKVTSTTSMFDSVVMVPGDTVVLIPGDSLKLKGRAGREVKLPGKILMVRARR